MAAAIMATFSSTGDRAGTANRCQALSTAPAKAAIEIKSKYGAWPVLLSRGENEINFQTRIRLKQLPVNVIYQTVYELNHAMPKIKFVLVQNNPNDPRIDLSLNYLMFESQIIDSDILVALFHVFDESVEIVFDAIGELIDN